ncbi:magnesium transporter CorA family protein [Anaerosphaera multitolerans]|uniref:Magnesium transporter CorA family protein n=1 Tax=Anaerosphaera multitolerans TaxID=2487351 RepID=A0A437S9K2_9FIRM|nr:CorA family divalent cation transporter [Anaerosphaera multitolerans]RVU55672.1 hypothetical protein EF514_00205 [Anaerosphaera multitolerans]
MKIYNLTEKIQLMDLNNLNLNNYYLIMSDIEEFKIWSEENLPSLKSYGRYVELSEEVHYESMVDFDFLNFIYYESIDGKLSFDKVNIILNPNMIIILSDKLHYIYNSYIRIIIEEFMAADFQKFNPTVFIYYQFLNRVFSKMFEALSFFESKLANIENLILEDHNNFELTSIVSIKNESFQVQKLNRQLLYVGDQLVLNDNEFFDKDDLRYLHNIDAKINKLYEYSADIYEMAENLMEIYDSSVTSHTNNLVNKLTILTVVATPLTVITGLYGMNFEYMPELKSRYGYYVALLIMILSVILTITILKKKKVL